MTSHFKKIGVIGRYDDPRVYEPMTVLVRHLDASGIRVYAADTIDACLDLVREIVTEKTAAHVVDIVGVAVIGRTERDHRTERGRSPRSNLRRHSTGRTRIFDRSSKPFPPSRARISFLTRESQGA